MIVETIIDYHELSWPFERGFSERVQVNPDNSRVMSALTFLLFKLNTLQTKSSNFESAEAMV